MRHLNEAFRCLDNSEPGMALQSGGKLGRKDRLLYCYVIGSELLQKENKALGEVVLSFILGYFQREN